MVDKNVFDTENSSSDVTDLDTYLTDNNHQNIFLIGKKGKASR